MYLNCKTYYSFRYGTFSTEDLVKTALERGVTALALTNINSTYDIWDFVKRCREEGIKPIAGAEIRNGDDLLYILIAANSGGLKWINRFISDHLLLKKEFPGWAEVPRFFENSWDGFVIYPLETKALHELLPNERIGILPWEIAKLYSVDWKPFRDRLVVRQPVTVQDKKYHALHRLLRCIDQNLLLSKLPAEKQCSPLETFVPPSQLIEQLKHYPFIITNTYQLMDSCKLEMELHTDKNKKTFSRTEADDRILLEKLATDGLIALYGKKNKLDWESWQLFLFYAYSTTLISEIIAFA